MMNILLLYNRNQNRVENDFVTTVVTTAKISCKSITSLHRGFSLLKLPDVIKSAVKEGKIGVSQGYVFAANLDNPGLMETFNSVLETPTNPALENNLASYKKKKQNTSSVKSKPFAGFYQSLKYVRATVEKVSAERHGTAPERTAGPHGAGRKHKRGQGNRCSLCSCTRKQAAFINWWFRKKSAIVKMTNSQKARFCLKLSFPRKRESS